MRADSSRLAKHAAALRVDPAAAPARPRRVALDPVAPHPAPRSVGLDPVAPYPATRRAPGPRPSTPPDPRDRTRWSVGRRRGATIVHVIAPATWRVEPVCRPLCLVRAERFQTVSTTKPPV